ncbi:MAG: hypothetical protein ACOYXO_19510, partial [Chloroflexota bacterium]
LFLLLPANFNLESQLQGIKKTDMAMIRFRCCGMFMQKNWQMNHQGISMPVINTKPISLNVPFREIFIPRFHSAC